MNMKITYKDVEGVRLNKEQYSFINYNFNKAFPNFPDTFNFNDIVSRYGIRDRRTNLSSSDIMFDILNNIMPKQLIRLSIHIMT